MKITNLQNFIGLLTRIEMGENPSIPFQLHEITRTLILTFGTAQNAADKLQKIEESELSD